MLSKEGTDIFVEGESMYSFMKGYQPPAEAAPYLFDLTKTKLLGLKDWIAAGKLARKCATTGRPSSSNARLRLQRGPPRAGPEPASGRVAVSGTSDEHADNQGIFRRQSLRPPQTSRWRSLVTQESVATLVVSVVVAAAVLLPLFTLVVSSFPRARFRRLRHRPGDSTTTRRCSPTASSPRRSSTRC